MSGLSTKQKVLLAVLALAVVVVWTRALRSPSGRPALPAPSIPAAATVSPPEARPLQDGEAVAELPAEGWKDSPFLMERSAATAPTGGSEEGIQKPAEFVLNGVLWNPSAPSAVVNNRVVGVGDSVGPWTVLEIRRDRVILSDGMRTKTLEVK